MKRPLIAALNAALKETYGGSCIPYGTSEDEEAGTGFRVVGIDATFSAVCLDDTPKGKLDIQVESFPPGEYLFNDVLDLKQFMSLIEAYRAPFSAWPVKRE